ncbi:MAG: nucleotide exchange factor GrpE, partial [bacterium]
MKIHINSDEEKKSPENNGNHSAEDQNEETAASKDSAEQPLKGAQAEAKTDSDIDRLAKKNNEYLDHLQRLQAEFENYKKRTIKEKSDTIKYASGQLAEKLLPVVDNLQRGLKVSADNETAKEILNGIRMVERQLLETL